MYTLLKATHGAAAGAPDRARAGSPGGGDLLGRSRRPRLGRDQGDVRCSTPSSSRARSRWRTSRARANGRLPSSPSTTASSRPSTSSPALLQQTDYTATGAGRHPRRVEARRRHVARLRDLARNDSRAARPRRVRVRRSGRQAARRRHLREGAAVTGTDGRARGARGRGAGGPRPRAAGRAAGRQRLAVLDRGRAQVDQAAGRSARRSATARSTSPRWSRTAETSAGQLQPERAPASDRAGHALPDHLLRRRPERARLSRPAPGRLSRSSACRCR